MAIIVSMFWTNEKVYHVGMRIRAKAEFTSNGASQHLIKTIRYHGCKYEPEFRFIFSYNNIFSKFSYFFVVRDEVPRTAKNFSATEYIMRCEKWHWI